MIIYEIAITNNSSDKKYIKQIKNITLEDAEAVFIKEFIEKAIGFGYAEEHISITSGAGANEILHGIAQYSESHLEGSLAVYEEDDFLIKLAAEPDYVLSDNFSIKFQL